MKLSSLLVASVFTGVAAKDLTREEQTIFTPEAGNRDLRNKNKLREGLATFHSKTYQEEKARHFSSKEYQEKKAKYLRENPMDTTKNGQFVSRLDDHQWSIATSDAEATECYEPIKYQKSGCCSFPTCQTFGCMVNKGEVDDHTPCDPTGDRTGTKSFVFCSDNGCKDSHTCSNCWCGKLDIDHQSLVNYDLSHGTLYYAFTTEWLLSQLGCANCFNNGDIDAMKDFMEENLNPGSCLPQFDGTAHNGMRCSKDSYCKSGRCSKGYTCEDKLDNNSFCGEDGDCKSGRCSNLFLCKDKIGKGGWCGNDGDCQSNSCKLGWWGPTCR